MGRGKIPIKKIEDNKSRRITFCKRKNGLLKKAYELSLLCDAEVVLLIFSNSGRLYEFANNSVNATLEKYLKTNAGKMPQAGASRECNHWEMETRNLKQKRDILTDAIRQLMGESLDSLSVNELKQIEISLQKGISCVRSKKNEMLLREIENLQRKECLLLAENRLLHSKIKDSEGFPRDMDQVEASFSHLDTQNFLERGIMGGAEQHSQTYSVVIQTALQLG